MTKEPLPAAHFARGLNILQRASPGGGVTLNTRRLVATRRGASRDVKWTKKAWWLSRSNCGDLARLRSGLRRSLHGPRTLPLDRNVLESHALFSQHEIACHIARIFPGQAGFSNRAHFDIM